MADTKPKQKKIYRKDAGALAQIKTLQAKTGRNNAQISDDLGYGAGAISHWFKTGRAPLTAGLAAEGLLRRLGAQGNSLAPPRERVYVMRVNGTKAETAIKLLQQLGVRLQEV